MSQIPGATLKMSRQGCFGQGLAIVSEKSGHASDTFRTGFGLGSDGEGPWLGQCVYPYGYTVRRPQPIKYQNQISKPWLWDYRADHGPGPLTPGLRMAPDSYPETARTHFEDDSV